MSKEINVESVLTSSKQLNMLYTDNIATKKISDDKLGAVTAGISLPGM